VTSLPEWSSTRGKTRFEILTFLSQNESPQLFKDIEDACSAARNTVKKYLEELKDEGLVKQSLHGRHPYSLSEDMKDQVKSLLEKQEIKAKIDQMTPQESRALQEFLDSLLKGEEFWVWPEGIHGEAKIIKYKAEKKIPPQD